MNENIPGIKNKKTVLNNPMILVFLPVIWLSRQILDQMAMTESLFKDFKNIAYKQALMHCGRSKVD